MTGNVKEVLCISHTAQAAWRYTSNYLDRVAHGDGPV